MATQSIPVSEVIRRKDEFQDEPKKKTREDWRKAKELEEARKAGTAPAAVDEEGRDINPHIPQYISTAPWYFGSEGPTLKHQRPQPEKQQEFSRLDEWYKRGVDSSKLTIKYRPGACENCGAVTHKKKDCMERPRKVGAKFTGADIAPDEFVQPMLSMDYDGKRDRWNGYDPVEHRAIVDQYNQIEEAKRQLKANRLKKGGEGDNGEDEEGGEEGEEEDEDKYVEEADMPGTKVDSKQRITVRNLRIREDTAKYLRNLDPNSAYYDPKTRSMRDNPYKDLPGGGRGGDGTGGGEEEVAYAGENFVRFTGDTVSHSKAQIFAWEAYDKGVDVNLQAEPTKLEMLRKEFEKKKDDFKGSLQQSVLEKYGGAEHLDAPPKQLLLAQTEDYVEYSRHGKVVKGQEKQIVSSRYEEDIMINNHACVWGSYWRAGRWGFKCCHSFVKNSYCTGEAGKSVAAVPLLPIMPGPSTSIQGEQEQAEEGEVEEEEEEEEPKTLVEIHREKQEKEATEKNLKNRKKKEKRRRLRGKKKVAHESDSSSSSSDSEDEDVKKRKKLKEALLREEFLQAQAEKDLAIDDRKRAYNSRYEVKAPTEEEMEAYYMKRARAEDPMADFL